MWRTLRIAFLTLVFVIVAGQALVDRFTTTSWKRTVYVGAFPVAADQSQVTRDYLAQLDQTKIDEVGDFVTSEARRYGVSVDDPIELHLYPTIASAPPVLDPGAGVLTRIIWSLRLRYYRHRMVARVFPRPQIALFLVYHDPALTPSVPHSAGLQRGLTGVVHVFASPSQEAQNRIVMAHELLHTFGALDHYDLTTGLPNYPDGFADPQLSPLYPQRFAEIMAVKTPISPTEARMPDSLQEERVGSATAREVGWVRH
jgi:hypothetical protein